MGPRNKQVQESVKESLDASIDRGHPEVCNVVLRVFERAGAGV